MTVRRTAATLAATATVLCAAAAPAAVAAPSPSPTPSVALPSGLYGTKDPTYDGVWRQSLAFIAQKLEGVTPRPRPSTGWSPSSATAAPTPRTARMSASRATRRP